MRAKEAFCYTRNLAYTLLHANGYLVVRVARIMRKQGFWETAFRPTPFACVPMLST